MKEWFTAAELAALALPGLPATESSLIRRAKAQSWQAPDREYGPENQRGVWRRRQGRGGGLEYHMALLPAEAQAKLAITESPKSVTTTTTQSPPDQAESWRWFEALPDKAKAKATRRAEALDAVLALVRNKQPKDVAVALIAPRYGASVSSVWGWFRRVEGLDRAHWAPALADRYAGRQAEAEISPEAWEAFKADYLRLEQPTAEACYARLQRLAAERGWQLPSAKTCLRKVEREIAPAVLVLARKGEDALKKMYPAQERDRGVFHAMEAINGDGHKFDVFVRWPDGEVGRPMMVAFQDLYSGKIVGWRIDKSENRDAIRLALGDVIEDYGIVGHIWFDNTRAFANKALTAGTQSRFRFKVRDEDPVGLCALLGIQVHFTLPYSGQSKPIERAFRDLCDTVARHPAFVGAWVGNNPMAKPENYGSKAVPLDEFLKVLSAEIIHHNARPGRRTKVCGGTKSFDDAFAESYAVSPIRQAHPEQRRLWLLAAEGVRAAERDGKIKLMGNTYWCEALHDHLGHNLIARFDPQDLVADLHVYRLDGGYIGAAQCLEAAGFADLAAAREHGRARRSWMKAQKTILAAERRMDAAQFAAMLPEPSEAPALSSKVVVPVFQPPSLGAVGPRRVPVASPVSEAEQAVMDRLAAEAETPRVVALDTAENRLRRVLEIERRIESGDQVSDEDRRWAAKQARLPDIRARREIYEEFGEAALTA